MHASRDFLCIMWAAALLVGCAGTGPSLGKPPDLNAAEELRPLESLLRVPPGERKLSDEQVSDWIELASTDNPELALVAALGLAYAADEVSLRKLTELRGRGDNPLLSGAAAYSMTMRKIRDRSGDGHDREAANLVALREHLSQATSPFERMFLANRIAVDYGPEGLPAIVNAIKAEDNQLVRCDMLYYVATADVIPDSREILDLEWQGHEVALSESLAFTMGSITPGRPKDPGGNSTAFLLDELRKKLAHSER